MENTVENMTQDVLDDAVLEPVDENQGEPLSTLLSENEKPQDEPSEQAKEPGWIKQRVGKAVSKAVEEAEARVAAKYEAMLAPIRESVLTRQAQDLVDQGEFKSLELAKEYVQLKNGAVPPAAPAPSKPAPGNDNDPVVQARASLLAKQAQKIKQSTGVDVMQAFGSDPDVKQRVLSGEWDFHDVADHLGQQGRRVPAPVHSPNGASVSSVSIANMTNEQFAKLQENLANGRAYDMRK